MAEFVTVDPYRHVSGGKPVFGFHGVAADVDPILESRDYSPFVGPDIVGIAGEFGAGTGVHHEKGVHQPITVIVVVGKIDNAVRCVYNNLNQLLDILRV